MQSFVDELLSQSTQTGMIVNGKKTKEMLIGSVIKNPPVPLLMNNTTVDRVSTFKLLGVHISNDLKWTENSDAVLSKIASRLYFLRQLKRAGATTSDLICFYCTVIRPILEYANPVWHSSLTVAQSDILESLQKRAMNVIYAGIEYRAALTIAGVETLSPDLGIVTRSSGPIAMVQGNSPPETRHRDSIAGYRPQIQTHHRDLKRDDSGGSISRLKERQLSHSPTRLRQHRGSKRCVELGPT